MASSSQLLFHLRLLLLFLLVAALLPLSSSIDEDRTRIVLKCESTIINDRGIVLSEVKNVIQFLEEHSYPTVFVRYTSVTGLSWCRSDISTTFCSSCRSIAASKIRKDCPSNTVAARFLYYDFCYLRFDAKNFIHEPDMSFGKLWSNMASGIVNKPLHWEVVVGLMDRLRQDTPGKKMMFKNMYTHSDIEMVKIAGMALCSLDLSKEQCGHCLSEAVGVITKKCEFHTFCEVIYGSCVLTYRTTRI